MGPILILSLSNCAYDPKNLTPSFIDFPHGVCREYKVKETKPKIVFEFSAEYPLSHCDGYISLPAAQALEIKKAYEEALKKGKKK